MSLDWLAPSAAQPEIEHLRQRVADLEAAQVRWQQTETGLREIAAHHHTLLQHLKQVVFQTDVEGRWLFLNPAWTEITGFEVAASLGQKCLDYIHPDDCLQSQALFQQLLTQDTDDCRHEIRYRHADGGFRWVEVWARLTVDEHDQVIGTTGTLMDISQRKQLEIALQQSEQNVRTFFDTIDDLLFVLDEQGRILFTNNTVARRLGYTPEDMHGQSVLMVHPVDRQAEAAQIVAAMLAGQAEYCPVPVQTKDGQQIPVETRVTAGQWNGQPAIFGVTKDLSALKASAETFTKAFQASPTLMALSEIDTGRYLDVNVAFLRTLGYTREEVVGHSTLELNLFANLAQREAALQLMQQQGFLRDYEVAVQTRSGDIRHGLFSAEFIQLQDRRVLLTVMNDITARQQAESALAASELKFRRVVEASAEAIVLLNEQGAIIEWNPQAEAMTGFSRQAVLGQKYWTVQMQLVPAERRTPDVTERLQQIIETALRTGQSPFFNQPLEVILHRTDGQLRHIRQFTYLIPTEHGFWMAGSARDITEQIQAQTDLRDSEQRYRTLAEASPDMIFIVDRADRIEYVNSAAAHQIGLRPDELIGQPRAALFPLDVAEEQQSFLTQVFDTGEPILAEGPTSFQGQMAWLSNWLIPLRDQAGTVRTVLGVSRDLTERKQLEERLADSERFSRATLDALYEHLCVLDDIGTIVAVNHAWRSFADANPPVPVNYGLGVNYLAVCDAARGPDADLAQQFAAGIRAVLSGEVDHFIMDYPCHSPGEQRWFTGKVTRFPGAGPVRLVVTHDNITDRKRSEEAVRQAEKHYRNLFENAPVMYALTHHADGVPVIADCNRQFAETLGYTVPEIIGRPIADLHAPASRVLFAEGGYERGLHGQFGTEERQLVTRAGRILTVLISAQPQHAADGRVLGTRAILIDVTDRMQAEARLRRFWDLPLVGMALTSTKRSFLSVNQKLADMFGYPAEQLAGMSWVDLTYPDDIAENIRLFDQTLAGERDEYDMDKRFIRRDGTLLYTHIAARCIRQLDGTVDHLALIIQDISERKQIEVALRSSEARQRALLTAIPDLMFVLNRAGVYLDYHAPQPDLLAAPPDTILGRALHEVLPPELAAVLKLKIEQSFQTSQIQTHVYSLDLATGPHYFEARLVVYDNDLVLIIVRDITDRKQAEAALRESQALYHSLVESSPLSICRKDLAGCFTFANRRFLDESQISLADLIGKTDFELHPPELAEKYRRDDQAVIASGQIQELIEPRARAQGETSVVQTIKVPIRDDAGRINGIQISFWDITERQQAQDALRDLTDTLERRVADRTTQLTAANLRLTELDRLKDEFISRISHELRTPLTNIISYLELLTYGKPEKHERYLGVLHTQTELFRKLIEDLLDVSRLRLDDAELRVSDFDLAIFIGSLVSARRSLLERRHIQIVLDLDTVHDTLTSDASVLRQVMVNILTNALSYTPEGGLVTLSAGERTAADRSWMTFAVRDSGPGISARDLPYIFEPFYRGAAANDYKTPGTGVGLTIAQRLIERLGGRITVESEIDHGATFTVWVPLIFGATR